jgi:hypothetical protein
LLNVNAVPSNLTNPVEAPFNVNNVTALAPNSTVPFAVTTAPTGTVASAPTLNVAPLATVNPVDAKLPLPVNASVPAFTLVAPVNVLAPLRLNVPDPAFTNDPADDPSTIAPANTPSFSVNTVPFNATDPDTPFNVSNSAAVAESANVPSTVKTAVTGNDANVSTDKVAPLATVTDVEARLPLPVNASVPAFTLVVPVNVFAPLNVNVPPLTFTNEPAEPPFAIAPANVPLLNVNAVPPNVTNPVDAPFNVNNVTALADNETVPSTVTTALTGTNAPLATLIVAPLATVNTVDAKLPLPVNANVPTFTLVVPV